MTEQNLEVVDGGCLCGAVRYKVHGPFHDMLHCHCSMCRKAHGSPFATFVGGAGLEWVSGRNNIESYASTPNSSRHFCRTCGSTTPGPETDQQPFVPAGCLEADCEERPMCHCFAESKAPWVVLGDDIPAFPQFPEGMELTVHDRPTVVPETEGALGGSCLCGAVHYEILGAPLLMANCHCMRCRKARGAAHATNLFVERDQLTWLAGEASVMIYDLPDAVRFGQNFCRHCGSPMPRWSDKISRYNVPCGPLDTDPGIEPAYHIFVGSKADWFQIADELVQHATTAS